MYVELYYLEFGNELGKEYFYFDYIVMLNMGGKWISFWIIYDYVDVLEVVGYYGGGGYVKVVGCLLINEVYN